jgi:phospholipid/cholesterol/gamma-HCH transport system substrate-binding protein
VKLRRKRKNPGDPGMAPAKAGIIAVLVIAFALFMAFTKFNPLGHPYKVQAVFKNVNNIKPNSPVRIAGVEVGKVKKVQPVEGSSGMTTLTIQLKKEALPLHKDTTMKVRPRTFLEGNYFVDIQPGSPSSPVLQSGAIVPASQTAAPVQFGDVLAALQSDTRANLQTFLKEYSKGLEGQGAKGFNELLRAGPKAFSSTAQVNDALLGEDPNKDLQRVLKGQARTFGALDEDEDALKGLVTSFNRTAGAFASQDAALEASVPALRDVLRVGTPALGSLNDALPTVRVFSREALPGVRSSTPTLKASRPFITQARLLVGPDELQGLAAQLRRSIPSLAEFNHAAIPLLSQARALSSCTNNVLVPFANTKIPNPDEPGNDGQTTIRQANRGFVGLAGESRVSDANNSYFRTSAVAPPLNVRPAAPTDGGNQPPPRRPDVPCETQDPPNLNAPGGPVSEYPVVTSRSASTSVRQLSSVKPGAKFNTKALAEAGKVLDEWEKTKGADERKKFAEHVDKLAGGESK